MTTPRSCEVKSHSRRLPGKKVDPAFLRKTEQQLWDELAGDECERALREALEADGGSFALHGGLAL